MDEEKITSDNEVDVDKSKSQEHSSITLSDKVKTKEKKKNTETTSKKRNKTAGTKVSKGEVAPVTKILEAIRVDKLKPIMIQTGWLSKVTIEDDGVIELERSWTEFILLLLGTLYDKQPNGFLATLVKYKALSEGFNINTSQVKYPESSGIKYEVYKLPDSNYFVEFRDNSDSFIKAIKGLLSALNIEHKNVRLKIEPINKAAQSVVKAKTKRIKNNNKESEEIILSSYDGVEQIKVNESIAKYVDKHKDVDINAIIVYGNRQDVRGIKQALILFLQWASLIYGDRVEEAGVKQSMAGVGMTDASHIDDHDTVEVFKIGDHYVYCYADTKSIARYLWNVAQSLNLKEDEVKVEYKELRLIKN